MSVAVLLRLLKGGIAQRKGMHFLTVVEEEEEFACDVSEYSTNSQIQYKSEHWLVGL
jgi:hypothetical protein